MTTFVGFSGLYKKRDKGPSPLFSSFQVGDIIKVKSFNNDPLKIIKKNEDDYTVSVITSDDSTDTIDIPVNSITEYYIVDSRYGGKPRKRSISRKSKARKSKARKSKARKSKAKITRRRH